jgi:hypothetical protein
LFLLFVAGVIKQVTQSENRAIISKLSLEKGHEDDLRRRGFKKKVITEICFKSTQAKGAMQKIIKGLAEEGISLRGGPCHFEENRGECNPL